MRPVKLSAAATVDLTKEYFEKNDILFIPTIVVIDDKEYWDDYEIITPRFLYDTMKEGKLPTTSSNPIMSYYEYWKKYVDEGYDIVHMDLSSGLSGTYNNAVMAAKLIEDEVGEKRVYVPDTLAASCGEALILDAANDMKNEGKSASEIHDWIVENRLRANHWFTLSDFFHLFRGGRVSRTKMILGSALNIYPIMRMDVEGKLVQKKNTRGSKKAFKTLVDIMEQRADGGKDYNKKVFITHSDYLEGAEEVEKLIKKKFKNAESIEIHDLHQIGVHTGPGTVSIFFWGEERID